MHAVGDVIDSNFKIAGQLRMGGQSAMYRAEVLRDLDDCGLKKGDTVAMKVLSLKGMENWKVSCACFSSAISSNKHAHR